MEYSHYQTAIFDWVKSGAGHGQGRALAGSGKTTTEVKSLEWMCGDVAMVAFNKSIADELGRRVPKNVMASTLHSFGLRSLPGRPRINQYKISNQLESRYDLNDNKQKGEYYKLRNPVTKLVALMKAEGQYTTPTHTDVVDLADNYGIESSAKAVTTAIEMLEESKKDEKTVDFDDMIFMPVYLEVQPKTFDWVAVDEYQDMNKSQNDLLNLMLSPFDGRMLAVGDIHQAIYGFRGAMAGIMESYVESKSATLLPLNICYRCSQAVIKEAQRYVPEMEASPTAISGEVDTRKFDPKPGEFALCRKVAPAVSACLKLIRDGKRATVRGREIGTQLGTIVEGLGGGNLISGLEHYRVKELERLSRGSNNDARIEALNDRVDTLIVVVESTDDGTVYQVKSKLKELFSDDLDRTGVIFSSIHKAKGLEAGRVWLLPSSPVKTTQEWQEVEEANLQYVAITRARKEFYYVSGR